MQLRREGGAFDSREARDARALAEHEADLQRRAAAHVARERSKARSAIAAAMRHAEHASLKIAAFSNANGVKPPALPEDGSPTIRALQQPANFAGDSEVSNAVHLQTISPQKGSPVLAVSSTSERATAACAEQPVEVRLSILGHKNLAGSLGAGQQVAVNISTAEARPGSMLHGSTCVSPTHSALQQSATQQSAQQPHLVAPPHTGPTCVGKPADLIDLESMTLEQSPLTSPSAATSCGIVLHAIASPHNASAPSTATGTPGKVHHKNAWDALETFGNVRKQVSRPVDLEAGVVATTLASSIFSRTRSNVAKSDPLTEAHLQTRHAQVAQEVQAYTRRLLASAGQDVLEFVGGAVTGRSALEAILGAVPSSKGQVWHALEHFSGCFFFAEIVVGPAGVSVHVSSHQGNIDGQALVSCCTA
jgi:hypothetical protein